MTTLFLEQRWAVPLLLKDYTNEVIIAISRLHIMSCLFFFIFLQLSFSPGFVLLHVLYDLYLYLCT